MARISCSKLFVGGLVMTCECNLCFGKGLANDTNETVLKDAFGQHGEIIEVKVICNHVAGKSEGYGFVWFNSETAASTALREMDGQLLDGRTIHIEYAHKGLPQRTQGC